MKGSISAHYVNDIVLKETLTSVEKDFSHRKQVKILEIGSGGGVFIQHLLEGLRKRNIDFVLDMGDIEPQQINSSNLSITCNYMDAQKEFSLDKVYDIIIAIELIEHIENPFHFVREIGKNISQNGVVLLTSPNILSLRSRLRYLFTGCYDYFRRPYNEYWLNMGHVNPINPVQLVFILRKNGFSIEKITSNTTTMTSVLMSPIIPFLGLFTFFHYLLREKGPEQKKRNLKMIKIVLSPAILFGKTAIYKVVKQKKFIAEQDIWFHGDDNFQP
ncbi:MAG: class I SAM-dependent methyltransferase [Deltaproteobacteria bacterium]|nr:class I SAM-dependent methyltransferase [Deltaproteobacteria bacterium]